MSRERKTDIVEELREWAKVGEACPPDILEEAAAAIEHLRAVAGDSFTDIRKAIKQS